MGSAHDSSDAAAYWQQQQPLSWLTRWEQRRSFAQLTGATAALAFMVRSSDLLGFLDSCTPLPLLQWQRRPRPRCSALGFAALDLKGNFACGAFLNPVGCRGRRKQALRSPTDLLLWRPR